MINEEELYRVICYKGEKADDNIKVAIAEANGSTHEMIAQTIDKILREVEEDNGIELLAGSIWIVKKKGEGLALKFDNTIPLSAAKDNLENAIWKEYEVMKSKGFETNLPYLLSSAAALAHKMHVDEMKAEKERQRMERAMPYEERIALRRKQLEEASVKKFMNRGKKQEQSKPKDLKQMFEDMVRDGTATEGVKQQLENLRFQERKDDMIAKRYGQAARRGDKWGGYGRSGD